MGLAETFDVLANSRSPDIKPALIVALELRDPQLLEFALDAFLAQRMEYDDVTDLLKHLETLPVEVQERLARAIPKLTQPLKELSRHGDEGQQETMLSLLLQSTSVDVLEHLVGILLNDSQAQRELASRHMVKVVTRFIEEHGIRPVKEQAEATEDFKEEERLRKDWRAVNSAVLRGLENIPVHNQRVVLKLAFMLGDGGEKLICDALRHESRAQNVRDRLIQELVADSSEVCIRFSLRLLAHEDPYYRVAGRDILRGKRSQEDKDAIVRVLRRVPRATQRRWIRMSEDIPWLHLIEGRYEELGDGYAEVAYEEIDHLPLAALDKVQLWYDLANAHDKKAAEAAVSHLSRINGKPAQEAIESLVVQGDPLAQVAAIAYLESKGSARLPHLLAKKLEHDNEDVRDAAARTLARQGFQRYVNAFTKLDEQTRKLAGTLMIKLDPEVINSIGLELQDIDPAKRVRAMRIVESTETGPRFVGQIKTLLPDGDPRVRATAIQLYSRLGAPDALEMATKALRDSDARVQANAIECIARLKPANFRQLLIPMVKSNVARVRANACRAVWDLGVKEIAPFMFQMLNEPNVKMRVSGAWVLAACEPKGAIERVSEAIKTETNLAVRQRLMLSLNSLKHIGENIATGAPAIFEDKDLMASLGFGADEIPGNEPAASEGSGEDSQ